VKLWWIAVVSSVLLAQASPYQAEIETARAARIEELRADDGWLTVSGLFWLKPGKNVAGSSPRSDIVLPAKAPATLGVFELTAGTVTFTAADGVTVSSAGTPVRTQTMDFRGGDKTALAAGDLRLFLIRREDRVGIRMRDLKSAMRQKFAGLTYFPIEPRYRVEASFTPYREPRKIPIPNVLGQTPEMVSPGYVTFTIGGTPQRLEPVYETDETKDLFFIFSDLTKRDTTYPAGRFLHTPLPRDGTVTVDFNLAYNPPCAFTDFATCPLPPKQNQLPIGIEAGEKAYHGVTK